MNDYITVAEAAKECKCTRQNIMKLVNKKALQGKKKNNRWYVSKRAVLAYYSDKIFGGAQEEYKEGELSADIKKQTEKKEKEYPSALKVDIALKVAKLEKIRIENDEKKKILVNSAEIKNKLYNATRIIREALEALPARATPIILGLTAHETEQALKKEVNKVLMNLSEEL